MSNPFDVVRQFEAALCAYTGAPRCVTVTSCTSALMLAVAWFCRDILEIVSIPRYTYVGVAHSILNAGEDAHLRFHDEQWVGEYKLRNTTIWDCARWLRAGMYRPGQMMCVSFHSSKHLGLAAHGGAILLDDPQADAWLRKARFDGRTEGVHPKDDTIQRPAWHLYMTPATAAEGLMRLADLPKHNEPLPWGPGTKSDYADLSAMEIFR